eukprot:XP_011618643.1 PREDICTED: GRIP and coiled-coil domain-containing protein 1 [Takifugu rubripes]
MEKFGVSFGGGPSRKELLDTIESQKKQLVQYQTRFKDVVRAYKSLLKEKEALEASLKALTASQDTELHVHSHLPQQTSEVLEDGCSLHSEDSVDTAASVESPSESTRGDQSEEDQADPGGRSSSVIVRSELDGASEIRGMGAEQPPQATLCPTAEVDRRLAQMKSQLSTLTNALATVTQEKSRMEASFQADKRQLKQEMEELHAHLATMKTEQEAELHGLQQQLAECRARIITQQHEREQEQGDHVHQLRELQKILQQERDTRQDMELRLQDANATLLLTSQAADRGVEFEAHLNKLREERDDLRMRLQSAEEDQKKLDPRVEQLQQELSELKTHLQQQIHMETRKAREAEERACERAQAAELRVADLEQRVSELSGVLGSSEKTRQRDQQVAQRLRERILQLDTENKTLAIAASSRTSVDLNMDESQLDASVLKEKLQKLKKLLVLAAQRSPDPDLKTVAEVEMNEDQCSVLQYQQELRQVKEEFERYKQRAQLVLKGKNAKDGCQTRELEEVRDQLAELKEKYINMRIQSDEAEVQQRHQLEEQQQQAVALQLSHKQEVERLETLHRDNLMVLEAELHKQRERTMALLDEKDQELERLRAAVLIGPKDADKMADERLDSPESESESDAISQALRPVAPNEPTLLLYAEHFARKEVELGGLRRQKHRLEDDLHQLQAKLVANAERHDEEAAHLRAQLAKLIRDQNREGANMEYLKNIIYKFLTLPEPSGRQQTLGAILTILHFSPQERHSVMKLQAASWWSANR